MENAQFQSANQPPLDQSCTKGRFAGKHVLVTGGASGIGYAVAERFTNDGARVTILDIAVENGERAEKNLTTQGYRNVRFIATNVVDKQDCESSVRQAAAESSGVIDALVNSAVYFGSKGLDSTVADWRKSFDVNVIGASNMVQAVQPYMCKGGGSIVNFTSISAERAQPDRWTYSATKGAIKTITQNMALDLRKANIRVNSVCPGWTWCPEMAKASPDGTLEPMLPAVSKFQLLPVAHTSQIASVVAFLCSRDASYINGVDIKVDGGYTAIGPERVGDDSLFAANLQPSTQKSDE